MRETDRTHVRTSVKVVLQLVLGFALIAAGWSMSAALSQNEVSIADRIDDMRGLSNRTYPEMIQSVTDYLDQALAASAAHHVEHGTYRGFSFPHLESITGDRQVYFVLEVSGMCWVAGHVDDLIYAAERDFSGATCRSAVISNIRRELDILDNRPPF